MNTNRKTAIIVGVLILVAYSLLGSGNPEAKISGMILEVISGLAVITIAVLMFPLFKPYNKKVSFWYIVLRSIEGGLLVVTGILFLSHNTRLLELYVGIHTGHAYIFAIAALIFYYLLYQSKLIPRWISVWGVIAAILLILVSLLEVTGIISELMILKLPIVLNELVLAIWLIAKGFNPSASSTHESPGSWIPGAGASTRYRPALEDAQAMALPEGTVVAISRGLRFIGQRLDPRPFLAADVGSFYRVGSGTRGAFRSGRKDSAGCWKRPIQRGKNERPGGRDPESHRTRAR